MTLVKVEQQEERPPCKDADHVFEDCVVYGAPADSSADQDDEEIEMPAWLCTKCGLVEFRGDPKEGM